MRLFTLAASMIAVVGSTASAQVIARAQDVNDTTEIVLPSHDALERIAVRDTDYDEEAGADARADRVTYSIAKIRRGNTVPVPEEDVIRLCSDRDGCSVRMGMHNWDDTGRIASREFLFFYNRQNRAWRASLGDTAGTNQNNITEHINNSWACYFTDGSYGNWANEGDSARGFGLLSWNQYNADCYMTLID